MQLQSKTLKYRRSKGWSILQDISPKGNNVKVFTDPWNFAFVSAAMNKIYTLQKCENDKLIERKFRFPGQTGNYSKIDDTLSKENGKNTRQMGRQCFIRRVMENE